MWPFTRKPQPHRPHGLEVVNEVGELVARVTDDQITMVRTRAGHTIHIRDFDVNDHPNGLDDLNYPPGQTILRNVDETRRWLSVVTIEEPQS